LAHHPQDYNHYYFKVMKFDENKQFGFCDEFEIISVLKPYQHIIYILYYLYFIVVYPVVPCKINMRCNNPKKNHQIHLK
jgi:hypothetical protein